MLRQVQHHPFKTNLQATKHCKKTHTNTLGSQDPTKHQYFVLASLICGSKICHLQFQSFVSCKSHLQGRQFVGCFPLPGLMLMLEAARHISRGVEWKLRSVRRWLQHPATGNEFSTNGACLKQTGPHAPLVIVCYSKSSYCMINNKWGVPNFAAHTHTHNKWYI